MKSIMGEGGNARREFMKTCLWGTLGVAVVGMVAPTVSGCGSPGVIDPSTLPNEFDVSRLTGDNQALVTTSTGPDGAPILIVRRSSSVYSALSMSCTHEGCTINAPVSGVMTCPCHGAQFDLNGAVLRGPARASLKAYPTTYDATTSHVVVTFA